jgi:uncharacterized protein YkwD
VGKVTVLKNYGDGLCQVRLDYRIGPLYAEQTRLQLEEQTYARQLIQAWSTERDALRSKETAGEAMADIVQMWKDDLLEKLKDPPPVEPEQPPGPGSEDPQEDELQAIMDDLLAAINAARQAAGIETVAGDDALRSSVRRHLRRLASTGRVDHWGPQGDRPEHRAMQVGYGYDRDVGVGQVLAFGKRTADAVVEQWLTLPMDRAILLNPDYTDCGAAYVYAPRYPYVYLWGAVLATRGPELSPVESEPDPAQQAAEEQTANLERIAPPDIRDFDVPKLGEAAAALARAAAAVRAAQAAIWDLMMRRLARIQRLGVIDALIEASQQPIDVWACEYHMPVFIGAQTTSVEVPGYRGEPDTINIAPVYTEPGILTHGDALSDAAVFVNCALEPGHLRWRPLARYGTLTAVDKTRHVGSVTLHEAIARIAAGEREMKIDGDENRSLIDIPISYFPCNARAFEIGDEVLVIFEGMDRQRPKIIGFRQRPRRCPEERNWAQF